MNCHSCGGSEGLIIHEVSTSFPTLPEHKYKEFCIQQLRHDIDKIKESIFECEKSKEIK